jgi:molecular chaperone DnaJ
LGAKVDVPTIDGRAQLKIPPARRAGKSCACASAASRARSAPRQRGDQIVTVEVVVPQLNDERSREIMREFAKLNNQDPRVRSSTNFDRATDKQH